MKKTEPFKVTIEHWGESVFVGKEYSDLNIGEALDLCLKALIIAGFTKEQIDKALQELTNY